jgi:tetratricopeptide (TPR) repeat protein
MGADGECWNKTEEYNGYDLCVVVRDFLRANGFDHLSIAEVLWSEGREGVGEATVFFSHIQNLPIQTTLQTLREASKAYMSEMGTRPRFFLDYLGIRQAQKGDFDIQVVRKAIHDTPLLLVELDGAKDGIGNAAPNYFQRSFCDFEVFCAMEDSQARGGVRKVLVFGPAAKDPKTAPWLASKVNAHGYNIVNSCNAQCRWPEEKEKIDQFIQDSVGFAELDRLVGAAVADGCVYGLQTAAAVDPSRINAAAQAGVQAADLSDALLQQFCTQHQEPSLVREVDLNNCSQIQNIECLAVFLHLHTLRLEGCHQIQVASLMLVLVACAQLRFDAGEFLMTHGRVEEALAGRKRELAEAQQTGDKHSEGRAYGNIASALISLSQYAEAIKYCKKRINIAQQIDDKAGEGRAYGNIGNCLHSLGHFNEAITQHKKELAIAQQTGDKAAEGAALGNIGTALGAMGRFEDELEHHKKDLEIKRQTGNKSGEAAALGSIGNALEGLKRFFESIEYLKKQLELTKQTGDRHSESNALGNIGNALKELGQFSEALEYLTLQLEMAKQIGTQVGEGTACFNISSVYTKLNDQSNALKYMKCAHEVFSACLGDSHPHTTMAVGNIVSTLQALGNFAESIEFQQKQLVLARNVGESAANRSRLSLMRLAFVPVCRRPSGRGHGMLQHLKHICTAKRPTQRPRAHGACP